MLLEIARWIGDETVLQNFLQGANSVLLLAITAVCIYTLSKGADCMIDGVVHLARRTGLPRIVIGATILSLGTTAPEAFVSVMAAWMGNPGLALGNGVGSIIADTGLIFGLACLIARIPMNQFILNRTGWVQVGAATLLVIISVSALRLSPQEPILGRWTGVLFLILLAGYMYLAYVWAKQGAGSAFDDDKDLSELFSLPKCWILLLVGLTLVIISARILVATAAELAVRFGMPEDVIAATIVAFGTSLPELMTAIASIRKGHPEIMVGNVVGADVLNCLFVIGAAAVAKPLSIPPNFFTFHFPAMIVILYSFRVFIFMNQKGEGVFKRWQGGWLLGVYSVYVVLQYVLNVGTVH